MGAFAMILWVFGMTMLFIVGAKAVDRYRVGEVFEIVGMDILDQNDKDIYKNGDITYTKFQTSLIFRIEERQRKYRMLIK